MSAGSYSLQTIQVASPCQVSWDQMTGDERTRFCPECQLHVYNLSALSRPEAEELLRRTEGRLCVRLYRRADGTVLTSDCPVGLRALRRRLATVTGAAGAVALALIGWAWSMDSTGQSSATCGATLHIPQPFQAILDWLYPSRTVTATMGKPCAPPPTAPAPGNGEAAGGSDQGEP
jgi:hypothetical protein